MAEAVRETEALQNDLLLGPILADRYLRGRTAGSGGACAPGSPGSAISRRRRAIREPAGAAGAGGGDGCRRPIRRP